MGGLNNVFKNCVAVVVLLMFIHQSFGQQVCDKIDSCSCKQSDGRVIDLSPLTLNSLVPKFQDVKGANTANLFSWNPCSSFTEEECKDVAVCEIVKLIPNQYIPIGTQDSVEFLYDNASLIISYSANSVDGINALRRTDITLVCDPNSEDNFTAFGPTGVGSQIYNMELVSKHACPQTVTTVGDHGLSGGWVFVIIVLVLLTFYCVVGAVYNKTKRNAEGMEIIPYQPCAGGVAYVQETCCASKNKTMYASV